MNRAVYLVVPGVVISLILGCTPHEVDERFLPNTYTTPAGDTLRYRLFVPDLAESDTRYPLIVFLHGGQGAGTDNLSQISKSNWTGSHVWLQPDTQRRHPAFVAAPQLPGLHRWDYVTSDDLSTYGELVIELIEELAQSYPVDRDRIYVTGQSRGGWGVWDLIAKRPDLFAAAIPVCGGGNPRVVSTMRGVSIWVFHGARDREVNVERSREMVEALRTAGSNVNYSEYRFSGHAIWDKAYGEKDLIDWVFAKRKQR
jgi:predicted peptidase